MSCVILTLEELIDARNTIDHLHEGVIDLAVVLESGNWGLPAEGTEEIRGVLARLGDIGFSFLEDLDKYIEWVEDGGLK